MKNIFLTIVVSFSLLFIGCADEAKTETDNTKPILVKANTPTYYSGSNFSASGTVKAKQNANISTRMMGTVQKILIKTGKNDKKGQLLIQIDNKDILAQTAQAKAGISQANTAFQMAEKNYKRFSTLLQKNSISQKEFEDVETNYKMAKSHLEMANQAYSKAQAQLNYANIRAPFDGMVTNRFINTGDIANPGMPLMHIENFSDFEVLTMIPEAFINKIQQDDEVTIIIKSNKDKLTGSVAEISRSAAETGGQFLVRIAVLDNTSSLLSGMFTSVIFPYETTSSTTQTPAIIIPKTALINKGQLSGVYTIGRNNVALLRWLKIGKTYGDQVEVLSGLKKDEQYIESATGKLYNGVKVQIQ